MGTERHPIQAHSPCPCYELFPLFSFLHAFYQLLLLLLILLLVSAPVPFASFVAASKGKSPLLNI